MAARAICLGPARSKSASGSKHCSRLRCRLRRHAQRGAIGNFRLPGTFPSACSDGGLATGRQLKGRGTADKCKRRLSLLFDRTKGRGEKLRREVFASVRDARGKFHEHAVASSRSMLVNLFGERFEQRT